jgi:hypothetical protein
MSTPASPPDPGEAALADNVVSGSDAERKPATAGGSPDGVDLPSGREFTESGAISFAQARPVRWVVIAGQVKSGKTTLLSSLYEMFQWSAINGFRFAGSNTLPALEEVCHFSRIASSRDVPDTPRTPYKPTATYLHLKVSPIAEVSAAVDFLFTDVSGEMFEHARTSTDDCKELLFLRRAAAFILVLDGEKAVRPDRRWAMVEEAKSLLQSCLDSSMLPETCRVKIVWSKVDYFEAASLDKTLLNEFRIEVERSFRASFGERIRHFAFAEIAARPTKSPQLSFGHGLPELLDGWVRDYSENESVNLFPDPPRGVRESELFALRQPTETDQ